MFKGFLMVFHALHLSEYGIFADIDHIVKLLTVAFS